METREGRRFVVHESPPHVSFGRCRNGLYSFWTSSTVTMVLELEGLSVSPVLVVLIVYSKIRLRGHVHSSDRDDGVVCV